MKNYHYQCRRKTIRFLLSILAFYLLASLVEGRFFAIRHAAAATPSRTSSGRTPIITTLSTLRLSTPFVTTAFLQPSTIYRRDGISSRNSYFSTFVHNSYTNNYSSLTRHSSLTHSSTTLRVNQHHPRYDYTTKTRLSSNQNDDTFEATNNVEEVEDDECSLQKLYQQVQTEDSEWYYQTFSKLLDVVVDDPLDFALCDKSRTNNMDAKVNADDIDVKKQQSNKKNKVWEDEVDVTNNEIMSNAQDDRTTLSDGMNVDSKQVEIEVSIPSVGCEDDVVDGMNQSNIKEVEGGTVQQLREQEVENVKEEPSRDRVQDDMKDVKLPMRNIVQDGEREDEQPLSDRVQPVQRERSSFTTNRETYERGVNDDDDEAGEDMQARRMKPPVDLSVEPNADKQQTKSSGTRSQQLVRLRNTYTGEVVKLCALSTLFNIGYSKKEVLVLRPKVLELIIEDCIPRPKKGLPKRWVRLSKLEGYDGKSEEEEEDEEDIDWEVEVIAEKLPDTLTGLDAKGEKDLDGGINETAKKSPQISESKEPVIKKSVVSEVADTERSKSIPREERIVSNETKRSSDPKKIGQVSESWGPFTSSRLTDETYTDADDDLVEDEATTKAVHPELNRRARTVDEDNDEISRRNYDNDEVPPRKKRANVYRSKYAEDDDYAARRRRKDVDDRRPQQPQRRKRVDETDARSKTSSQRSSANQQRRQRQRPSEQRRELVIDRGDDDEPPPNKFWMDLPTFRDYLRTEAQLRLKILGPDWKESVLDESRWRYDLYKTWLTMLDEGVGENPLYEYGERPRRTEERRRPPPPPPRSRSEREVVRSQRQRRQQERGFDDEEDDADYDDEIRPRRRSQIPPEGQRSRSRVLRNSSDRRPPPKSMRGNTWRNFSDLEESLQSSSKERSRPVRSYPIPRSDGPSWEEEDDDEEDNGYFDNTEDIPRSRSRSSRGSTVTRARGEYTEPERDLPNENERATRRSKATRSKLESDDFDEAE